VRRHRSVVHYGARLFLGMNKLGAAFGRFLGGGFEDACALLGAPFETIFASSPVSSVGTGRFRLGLSSLGFAVLSIDDMTGRAAEFPLFPADMSSRGVNKVFGTVERIVVSDGWILDCVLGAFVED